MSGRVKTNEKNKTNGKRRKDVGMVTFGKIKEEKEE